MGIVLEATDLRSQCPVAVKLLSPQRAKNPEARKRFVREARASLRLQSEYVTRLVDVGELDDGTPYLVMEYLVGATLEELLLRDGPLPIDTAIDWVLQALTGVGEAHRLGLVHRDLKPENLFLCERRDRGPIVKVLDFGTVKDLVTKGTKLTRTGSTMGSPAYMPPEQVRADEIDARADVWAMGATLYELLTGRLPFEGESVPATLASILRDPHAPIRKHRAEIPVALEALIDRTLSKDPAGRFASAAEFHAALSALRSSMRGATRGTQTVPLTKPMGQAVRVGRADPFADTTDMSHVLVASIVDKSQVRPRLERQPDLTATIVDRPRRRGSVVAAMVALTLLGVTGAFAWKHHARHPLPANAAAGAPPPVATTLPPPAVSPVAPSQATPAPAVSAVTATPTPTPAPVPAPRASSPRRPRR
jgi:serine/threonine-protein kinase